MPRTTLALTSFVSGEFSAKLDGRTDFEKYSSGCKTLENMLVHPQGAATRRVGTQFISEVKDSSAKTRLIPFEFSTTQTYMLEFGNQYIRFFKDKGQITESNKTITAITAANPAVVTSNNTTQQNMIALYQEKLRDARFVDSTEGYNTTQEDGMADVIDAGTFINSRF